MDASASMPFVPARRTSISVTSGRRWRNATIASGAVAATATRRMSGWALMIVVRPSRKTGWSSTLRIEIGFGAVLAVLMVDRVGRLSRDYAMPLTAFT